ncbi:MAG: helix-turn-helix domain-containing protein [Candidatus Dadabacteria bacterium]
MEELVIRAMTIKELAALYQVSIRTFRRWLRPYREEIGQRDGWFYKPSQVKTIIQMLGEPG